MCCSHIMPWKCPIWLASRIKEGWAPPIYGIPLLHVAWPCELFIRSKFYFWANSSFSIIWILHAVFLNKVIAFVWQMFQKRVKFDPNIKILHHNLFVVYNCFRRDENDTVLKWVERLRRLIFWWLEIWAFPGSLLYRDQIHTLVWMMWIAN